MQGFERAGLDGMDMANPKEKRIIEEAAAWVVKFDGVDFNTRDVAAFRRWIGRSPAHHQAFETTSRAWNRLDLLSKLENIPLPVAETPQLSRRMLIGGAGAALLALGVGVYALTSNGDAIALETGPGEVRSVALGDGTTITLNASSRFEAHISKERRTLRIVRGEALVSVGPDAGIAMSILTPAGGVLADSGEVLVKLLPNGVRISLISGGARAWGAGQSSIEATSVASMSDIEFTGGDVRVAPLPAQRAERRTLWREGMLAFDNTPLSEAAADVTRQTGVRIRFTDPALAELRVGGLVRANDVDAFLALLRDNLAIDAEQRGNEILLSTTATL